jgi:hypothetical protein
VPSTVDIDLALIQSKPALPATVGRKQFFVSHSFRLGVVYRLQEGNQQRDNFSC